MLCAAMLFTACGGGKKEEAENKPKETTAPVLAATGNPADELINDYMKLKDALVKDSLGLVNEAAKKISDATLPDSAKLKAIPEAMRANFTSLNSEIHARVSILATANDLKMKRTIFKEMTPSVRHMVEKYGSKTTVVYQQHCPMAFDNTGASWLSMETKIRNPYLPKTMLKCGLVEDTVRAKN